MPLRHVRRLAVLGALAVTTTLSACGDSPTPASVVTDTPASTVAETGTAATLTTTTTLPTATSTHTTTLARSTPPTSEPADPTVEADISVNTDTIWEEVFATFTVSERSCIRDAVDIDLLESVLDRLVLESSEVAEQWGVSVFSCLAPETASALFLSFTIAGMEGDDGLNLELTDREIICLREWVAGVMTNTDWSSFFAGLASDDPSVIGEHVPGLFGCVQDVLLSAMLEKVSMEFGILSEDEASCLRELVTTADFGVALLAGDPDGSMAFDTNLVECIADVTDVPAPPDTVSTLAFDNATPVIVDQEKEGELDRRYKPDLFVFDAVEGKLYQIEVALGTLRDTQVTLYDAEETVLGFNYYNENSSFSEIVWVAPNSGRYYIEVGSWDGDTGTYTLNIDASDFIDDHADTIAEATYVTTGEPVPGTVNHSDDLDMFVFDAAEGKLYQIDVTLRTLINSQLTLYNAELALVEYSNYYGDSLASRIVWKAPSSGRYYVEVGSWVGYTGTYTLTIDASDFVDDHADTVTEATPVITGEAVPGTVNHSDDLDMFVFDAAEGKLYQIDVTLGTLGHSEVSLFDTGETESGFNYYYSDTSAHRILWVAPNWGRYYVQVASWGANAGSYTLTVGAFDFVDDHANTVAEATPVITGEAVPGVVDHPRDLDRFVFDAVDGNLYQIDVALGTLSDPVITLYNAYGSQLSFDIDHRVWSDSRILWEAPYSGRYYVGVASRREDTGSYTLTINAV